MLAYTAVVLLAGLLSVADAQACQSAPYKSLSCLANAHVATSICSGITQTITKTASTTTLDLVTKTTSQDAASQATVTETTTSSTTMTITVTSATVTSMSTDSSLFSRTTTTWTSAVDATPSPARRDRIRDGVCTASDAMSSMHGLSADTLATACSCLGVTVPKTTVTVTKSGVPARSTTTKVLGKPSTTTLNVIAGITFTETVIVPATTFSFTVSTSLTATSTITLAAPTYKQVFGPKAGCINNGLYEAYQLDNSITDVGIARSLCKGYCSQSRDCEMVYVQRLFSDWNSAMPYYQCQLNDHHLNVTADLECGQRVGTWGLGVVYNAYGRELPDTTLSSSAEPGAVVVTAPPSG